MREPNRFESTRKVLVAFLGTGNYQPCRYEVNGVTSDIVTYYCTAVASHIIPDQIISLQTEGAKKNHGTSLEKELASFSLPVAMTVKIPDGQSVEELWEIFDALTQSIQPRDQLYLDITHGFRSLPLLGFIATSYLRITRSVEIGGIYYGAFEARQPSEKLPSKGFSPYEVRWTPPLAPTFNLTPFLTLLDWTSAAQEYFSTGSAKQMGQLLMDSQQSLWQQAQGEKKNDLPKNLTGLGNALSIATGNLLLLRIGALEESIGTLRSKLERVHEQKEAFKYAKPFLEIADVVAQDLLRFDNTSLPTLRSLVQWLAQKKQIAASFTLAREWLVSYLMVVCGETNHVTDHKSRSPYEKAMNCVSEMDSLGTGYPDRADTDTRQLARQFCQGLVDITNHPTDQFQLYKNLVSSIGAVRNNLNHAGFNDDKTSEGQFEIKAQEAGQALDRLILPVQPIPLS